MENYLLTAYGLPHTIGLLPTKDGAAHPAPLRCLDLLDAAAAMGLAGVEFLLPGSEEMSVERLREELLTRNLRLVADYPALMGADAETFRAYLQSAAKAGAKVVRAMLSGTLCGDRRALAGGWDAHLAIIATRLKEVLPYAEALGVCIAVENHQDATTEDLLRLAEGVNYSPSFGVTLDTGNSLAVGQEPVETARRLAPLIRHVHLKDYTLHFAPQGYRLVRCAAGRGVINFPAILKIIYANGRDVLPGIEIAAQATRTIPLLDPAWWEHYPVRPVTELLPVLQILWRKGRPEDEPYSSAWEQGADSAAVSAEEWDVLTQSVRYFQTLSAS